MNLLHPPAQVEIALGGTILLFLIPQVPKEFCRCWPVPRIVVVAECENFQNLGIAHQRFEYVNPIFQIASAVDDGLVPRRCLLLNLFAISKPTNISEVRSKSSQSCFSFPTVTAFPKAPHLFLNSSTLAREMK